MQFGGNHASLRCKKPLNTFKWKKIVSPGENEDHHDFHGKLRTWSQRKLWEVHPSLETIRKQSCNSSNSCHQTNNDSNWGQSSSNCFSSVHIISCEPFLGSVTLWTGVAIRLQGILQKVSETVITIYCSITWFRNVAISLLACSSNGFDSVYMYPQSRHIWVALACMHPLSFMIQNTK